ncbi:DNA-directed RNA polymerase subunit delta [Paenibacillus cymbidii]|uniref:DNA-directed RNA polymerase subunit delta n=1 Tax=Paenibacillus cymbidii TaxID=1639034 RepID=UPI00107FD795|nr:DNA-directed RNA polymerase subunit delta [Paenibacillus cymbidii]
MSSQYQLKISAEQAQEIPMVDLAFELLKAANTPFYYRDLMLEIAKIKGFSDEQVMQVIAQVYTEINVDGRFACVGNNLWGLKRWYPVDNKSDDAMGSAKRPRIINDDDDDLDDEDYQEEEETYASDEEDFDTFDEDREDIAADEEEEEEEVFEEDLDEEDLEEDAEEGAEELEEDAEEDDFASAEDDEDEDDDK